MLVLKRLLNERIVIRTAGGEQITLQLVDVGRGYAKLGFEAALHTSIDREEVRKSKDAGCPPAGRAGLTDSDRSRLRERDGCRKEVG